MKMVNKKFISLIATILIISTSAVIVVSAADCYTDWYATVSCTGCDDSLFNTTQTDSCSAKHPRQNGIKLCSSHIKATSTQATYYKRGFSDYNCLAYALGKNGVQSWVWPSTWGAGPTLKVFKEYIKAKGYNYTTNENNATGTDIIYVYAINGYVKHFARGYTLDDKKVSGAATISKWGRACLYKTTTTDPYASTSLYGDLVLICYK